MQSSFEKKHPNLAMNVKPDLKGEWIITPKDAFSYQTIKSSTLINAVELNSASKNTKAVVMSYPMALPLEPLITYPNVLSAERMKNKFGNLTTAILTTFSGPPPEKVNLGMWGNFRVTEYHPEPLRCYRCQRFGHHKNQCTTDFRCGVCAGRHSTDVCLKKHKDGGTTVAKCPNCQGKHHAWHSRCPERLKRIVNSTECLFCSL